jgi:D-alanyl-D-alanine carboxypeptidase
MKLALGPVLTIMLSLALFHSGDAMGAAAVTASPSPTAVDPSVNPSASPTSSPTPTDKPSPKPTPTRLPYVTNFDWGQYSLVDASSPWVIVNKLTPLNPKTYQPKTLIEPKLGSAGKNPYSMRLARPAANALVRMARAMKADGAGTLVLQSGYRSYATQKYVHARQVARFGKAKGEALAARPGFSEHQTGLAADVAAVGQKCVIQVCFAKTKAGKWLAANAFKYGFVMRYQDGQTETTGYQFEPWHFRFVGVALATEVRYQHMRSLEQFWELPAAPNYQ